MFPTASPYITVGKKAGADYSAATKARSGSQSLSPPHVYIYLALLQTVLQDTSAPTELKDQIKQILAVNPPPTNIINVCKISKCFDHARTRLEIAVPVVWNPLLEAIVQLWVKAAPRNALAWPLADL
jgi:hypothetical protein